MMDERILCAAVWIDTGVVEPGGKSHGYPATGLRFCDLRHNDCFVTVIAVAMARYPDDHDAQCAFIDNKVEGFLTSQGRFVGRIEARVIAERMGQILDSPSTSQGEDLYSEDLY